MSRFEIGEIAIIIKCNQAPGAAGGDCEIVSGRINYYGRNGYLIMVPGYFCPEPQSSNGGWFAQEEILQKKKPPKENVSWDRVEEICGWNPTRESVDAYADGSANLKAENVA